MHERPEGTALSCKFEIRISENDCWSLSTKFHEYRLEILAGEFGDDPSDVRASCEVDLLDCWVLDESFSDCASIFGMGLNDIQDTFWKTSFLEDSSDSS